MNRPGKWVVLVLVLLCTQLLIPGVFWHGFSGHHDTSHCDVPVAGIAVSEQHLHCPAIDLVVQLAELISLPGLEFISEVVFTRIYSEIPEIEKRLTLFNPLRGPPFS